MPHNLPDILCCCMMEALSHRHLSLIFCVFVLTCESSLMEKLTKKKVWWQHSHRQRQEKNPHFLLLTVDHSFGQLSLPAVWSVRTLHQHTCRLLARIPHSKCFISPTPRTLPRWSSRAPGEPHAAASACCARPPRLLVILSSRLMPTLQVSSLK